MVIMMELQLQPLAAEGNGLLARNPDRGLRLELYMGEEIACDVFTVSRMANPAAHIERVIEKRHCPLRAGADHARTGLFLPNRLPGRRD